MSLCNVRGQTPRVAAVLAEGEMIARCGWCGPEAVSVARGRRLGPSRLAVSFGLVGAPTHQALAANEPVNLDLLALLGSAA